MSINEKVEINLKHLIDIFYTSYQCQNISYNSPPYWRQVEPNYIVDSTILIFLLISGLKVQFQSVTVLCHNLVVILLLETMKHVHKEAANFLWKLSDLNQQPASGTDHDSDFFQCTRKRVYSASCLHQLEGFAQPPVIDFDEKL